MLEQEKTEEVQINKGTLGMQGFDVQKASKPKIEDICDYFLTDSILKNGIMQLLEKCRNLSMKPTLISLNTFKCAYKGKKVVHFSIGGRRQFLKNSLTIGVEIAENEDLEHIILAQPDDVKKSLQTGNLHIVVV